MSVDLAICTFVAAVALVSLVHLMRQRQIRLTGQLKRYVAEQKERGRQQRKIKKVSERAAQEVTQRPATPPPAPGEPAPQPIAASEQENPLKRGVFAAPPPGHDHRTTPA